MLNLPNGSKLFEFQEKASQFILENTGLNMKSNKIILKSPTGSGKTLMLIDYIDKFYTLNHDNVSFIWVSIGQGELEEQSMAKMKTVAPHLNSQDLNEAVRLGFQGKEVTFINWESVTKVSNRAFIRGEKKNLQDKITEAHRNNIKFIIIVDEEHYNRTEKSDEFIDRFSAKHIVRASATTIKDSQALFYEVPESEVIESGLIARALYVNEDIKIDYVDLSTEHELLIDSAIEKLLKIKKEYQKLDLNINPLLLLQLPNDSDSNNESLLKTVEAYLETKGITYSNKLLAKWLSNDYANIDGIEEINAKPIVLICKQAISTGWDAPRAKILVTLRKQMNDVFELQTIGRIRRMPQATHYNNDILDNCYLYSLDEKYQAEVFNNDNYAFERRRLYLKDEPQSVELTKEVQNLDLNEYDEREIRKAITEYLIDKYNLVRGNSKKDKINNEKLLENNGFIFSEQITRYYVRGRFVNLNELENIDLSKVQQIKFDVSTSHNGIDVMHIINKLSRLISLNDSAMRAILKGIFHQSMKGNIDNLVLLNNKQWYAFIINNQEKLREIIKFVKSNAANQSINLLSYMPKETKFRIPLVEYYKIDPTVKEEIPYESNAYEGYLSSMVTHKTGASSTEALFEEYLELNENVLWYYKNGDKGEQYFSTVYLDGLKRAHHFYADYIVCLHDGSIWIIETKGGERNDSDKNIDEMVRLKFNSFKEYSMRHSEINWGFVRDLNERELYFNNTKYTDSLKDDSWINIKEIF